MLLLSTGADTAGVGYRLCRALRQYGGRAVRARQVAAAGTRGRYLAYPQEHVYATKAAGGRWYRWADVVHVANTLHAWEWWDGGRLGKRLVLHHHGTEFRYGHERLAAQARALGAVQVVATPDLLTLEPGLRWLPGPYNAAALMAYRAPRDDGRVWVAHAPTDRAVKGTAAVVAAVQQLQARGYPVELDLIEGVANAECLARKGRADIVVDQLALGYGVNALEAWGMGLPVVAGVASDLVRQTMLSLWGRLPFCEATPGTLLQVLRMLVDSPAARADWAARGALHAARYHDEQVVADLLLDIYAGARTTAGRTLPAGVS